MEVLPIVVQWFFAGLTLGLFVGRLIWVTYSKDPGPE